MFRDFFPRGDGVWEVEEPGAENKILVIAEGHLSILGGTVGRKLGAGPTKLLLRGSFHEAFKKRLAGLGRECLLPRIDVGHALGIFFRPEADGDINFFNEEGTHGIDEGKLLIGGGAEEDAVEGVGGDDDERIAAGEEDFFVHGFH